MTTVQEARQIVGDNNVFGPEEWKRFFSDKFPVSGVPEIPWSADILKAPGLDQPHFLFLGVNELANTPLNIKHWHELYGDGPNHPMFRQGNKKDYYIKYPFSQKTCEVRWYLMPCAAVKDSVWMPAKEQFINFELLHQEYEVPSGIERVTAHILYRLLTNEYLDMYNGVSTSTSDRLSPNINLVNPLIVSGNAKRGIVIDFWRGDIGDGSIGIAASRKT